MLGLAVVTDFIDALRGLPPSPAATAFDQLPADADDATRRELAIRLLPRSRTLRVMLPRLRSAAADLTAAARTIEEAVRDLYNPAQFDVLRRVGLLLRSGPGPVRTPQVGVTPGSDRVTTATSLGLTVPQRHGVHSGVSTAVPPSSTPGRPTQGERNDVGIVLSPDRAPLVLAVHTDPDDSGSTAGNATIAEATAIAVRRLVGQ